MIIHIAFNAIAIIVLLMFPSLQSVIFAYGWFPIIMIYIFREAAVDPDGQTRFCCLPFLIKRKYLPWVLAGFSLLFLSPRFFVMITAAIIGYYQSMVLKSNFIKLPFKFYLKLEACFPESVKRNPDFVPISQVEMNLKSQCCGNSELGGRVSSEPREPREPRESRENRGGFNNPF